VVVGELKTPRGNKELTNGLARALRFLMSPFRHSEARSDRIARRNAVGDRANSGAGLELAYAWSASWEAAAGAAFREYRFRLRGDGPAPNGLGQNRVVPLFARLTRKFGPGTQVELFAGGGGAGELRVFDAAGASLQSSDHGAAPLVAFIRTVHF
jgi:hypothetical protein